MDRTERGGGARARGGDACPRSPYGEPVQHRPVQHRRGPLRQACPQTGEGAGSRMSRRQARPPSRLAEGTAGPAGEAGGCGCGIPVAVEQCHVDSALGVRTNSVFAHELLRFHAHGANLPARGSRDQNCSWQFLVTRGKGAGAQTRRPRPTRCRCSTLAARWELSGRATPCGHVHTVSCAGMTRAS